MISLDMSVSQHVGLCMQTDEAVELTLFRHLQAVREADAAVEQASRLKTQKAAAASEANSRVQSLIADLDRLQQSQSRSHTC